MSARDSLHEAIAAEQLRGVQSPLRDGAGLNTRNESGKPALPVAGGDRFAVRWTCVSHILDRGAPVLLALLAALILYIGGHAASDIGLGHDTMILLDGAWRILQGQIPHKDFYTPLGPVTYQLVALAIVLSGFHVRAIMIGFLIAGGVVGVIAWYIARRRMSPLGTLVFTLFVFTTIVAKEPLGFPQGVSGYGILYNRLAFGFTLVILAGAFLAPQRTERSTADQIDFALFGALVTLTALTKVSFLAPALVSIIAANLDSETRQYWVRDRHLFSFVAGSALIGILYLFYLDFSVSSVIQDLSLAAKAHGLALDNLLLVVAHFTWEAVELLLIALTCRKKHVAALVVIASFLGTCLAVATNTQYSGSPLTGAAAIVLWELSYAQLPKERERRKLSDVAALVAAGLIACHLVSKTLWDDALTIQHAWQERYSVSMERPENQALRLQADGLDDVPFSPPAYVERVNEGLALLRAHTTDQQKLIVLDFSNPFSYALRRPSPRGDGIWWHEGITYTRQYHLPPDRMFREADIVLVSTRPIGQGGARLSLVYADYLRQHYRRVAASKYWILYTRT